MFLNLKNLKYHIKNNKKEVVLFLINIEMENIQSMSVDEVFSVSNTNSKEILLKNRISFWKKTIKNEDLSFKIIKSFLKENKYEIKINFLN